MLDRWFLNHHVCSLTVKRENVLTHEGIYRLHHAKHVQKVTPETYHCALIFILALLAAMKLSNVYKWNASKIMRMPQGKHFWEICDQRQNLR